MQIKILQGLAVRVGSIITVSALLFLTVFSTLSYQRTFQNEIQAITHNLSQLVVTVDSNATIACYLNNKEIATEVIEGLIRNDMVSGISISSTSGLNLATGNMSSNEKIDIQKYPISSPIDNSEQVGQISINPNQQLIEQRASNVAKGQVQSMAIQTLLIITLVMALVYWQLTKPIHFVALQLDTIEPGSNKRLKYPSGHQKDEIGTLVRDSNNLLETVKKTIEKEQMLRAQVEVLERRFRLIFDHASCGIALATPQGKLLLHNLSFEKLLGSSLTKELMESEEKLISNIFSQHVEVQNIFTQIPIDNSPVAVDLELIDQLHPRWLHTLFSSVKNEDDDILIEIICYDISKRTLQEKKNQIEANHDPLTKLLNRRGGMRQLNLLHEKCQKQSQRFAIFMIDLDKFKPINDTFGHEAGDKVLCTIAKRLKEAIRHNDIIIRFGGDEFLIVLTEGRSGLNAKPTAKKALKLLKQEIDLGEGQVAYVGGSIGISIYPDHGESISLLVGKADDAMYQIKEGGRNGYCVTEAPPCFPD